MHLGAVAARQFGNRDPPLGKQGHEGVLDLRQAAGDLLDAGDGARVMAVRTGEGAEGLLGGALGEQQRVVPAVLELVLGGARGALHGERAGPADGRRQQLGEHGLGGARFADEEQTAFPGEGDHAPFDQGAFADELLLDHQTARHSGSGPGALRQAQCVTRAAHHEGDDGPGGEQPAGRAGPGVVRGEESQLGGVPVLGRGDLPWRVAGRGRLARDASRGGAGRGGGVRGGDICGVVVVSFVIGGGPSGWRGC
ncbi:hypothetical protein SBADM41S_11798 [Streptomyces badius]